MRFQLSVSDCKYKCSFLFLLFKKLLADRFCPWPSQNSLVKSHLSHLNSLLHLQGNWPVQCSFLFFQTEFFFVLLFCFYSGRHILLFICTFEFLSYFLLSLTTLPRYINIYSSLILMLHTTKAYFFLFLDNKTFYLLIVNS